MTCTSVRGLSQTCLLVKHYLRLLVSRLSQPLRGIAPGIPWSARVTMERRYQAPLRLAQKQAVVTNCRFSPLQGGAKVACQTPDSSPRSVRLRLCQPDSNIDTRGVCDPNHNSHSRCRRGFNVNARYPGHSSGWYYSLAVSNINALSNSDAITHSHEHARADSRRPCLAPYRVGRGRV